MEKITAFVTNNFNRDPRVNKTANTLSAAGYDITVISITDTEPGEEHPGRISVVQLQNRYGRRINRALRKISSHLSHRTSQSGKDESYVPPTCPADQNSLQKCRYRIADFLEFAFLAYRNICWALVLLPRKADIYYANDLDTLLCAYLLSRFYRSGLIYDSHELYIECIEGSKQTLKSLLRRFEQLLIRRCNAVLTVNTSIAEELSSRYHIATPSVIYNCPTRTGDIVEHDTAEVTGRPVRIIYQGIYAADRGLEEIILSQKDLQHCELDLRILFTNPSDEERLARLIERENLSGSVRIIPPVSMKDLVRGLRGYDIGIIAYKPACLNNYYATPNKLFEYMMGGLALASSDLPEIRKIITRCENGVLFEPTDPHDIAMKLQELIADTQRLESMKERSRYYSDTVFTWENQEQTILDAVKCVRQT